MIVFRWNEIYLLNILFFRFAEFVGMAHVCIMYMLLWLCFIVKLLIPPDFSAQTFHSNEFSLIQSTLYLTIWKIPEFDSEIEYTNDDFSWFSRYIYLVAIDQFSIPHQRNVFVFRNNNENF